MSATTLLELHRAGRLAADYPHVCALVADLPEDELARAGRWLARLDPDEVLREHPSVTALTVAITGHGTLAPLVPQLTAELARHGLLARTAVSDHDAYVFDLADGDSALYAADPDLVLCVLDPMVVFDEVPVPWGPADVERVAREKTGVIERLAARFQAVGRGTLVLNTLPLPRSFSAQCVDHRSRAALGAVWREANTRLLRVSAEYASVVVVDLDPLIAEGVAAVDPRLEVYTQAHLSPALLAAYAREAGHLARHLAGRAKKALVLDLDGTVWGGVLGEDGPEGIEVAEGHRGAAHQAFQRVVKQLGAQGVLLAAVSKNDVEPVRAVFRDHPLMTLREEDLVRIIANWRPKHDNLTELAEALKLSTDAFVFVDDSSYECGLVRHALPSVTVLQVGEDPALHAGTLLRDGWFDGRDLTAEDRTRVGKYRDELVRKDFLDGFDSIEDYLRELKVAVRVGPVEEPDIARISQLTLRTNQFNLTTRRLQQTDVRELVSDPDALALGIAASDRFGDNGLVGAVFARRSGARLEIENFLLSCRVFSRGIEQAGLAAVLRHARATGAREVYGRYRATAKNTKVKDFYSRGGFAPVTDDGDTATFRHDLTEIIPPPEHISLTDRLGESIA